VARAPHRDKPDGGPAGREVEAHGIYADESGACSGMAHRLNERTDGVAALLELWKSVTKHHEIHRCTGDAIHISRALTNETRAKFRSHPHWLGMPIKRTIVTKSLLSWPSRMRAIFSLLATLRLRSL